MRLVVLHGTRTDDVTTGDSLGVKNVFCPEIVASTTNYITGGMYHICQSKSVPAVTQATRVEFVNRFLHQLQCRRHMKRSSVGVCTSCSTDGTYSARQSEPAPAENRRHVQCFQSEAAPGAAQAARVVFVSRSLHQLQHRRRM